MLEDHLCIVQMVCTCTANLVLWEMLNLLCPGFTADSNMHHQPLWHFAEVLDSDAADQYSAIEMSGDAGRGVAWVVLPHGTSSWAIGLPEIPHKGKETPAIIPSSQTRSVGRRGHGQLNPDVFAVLWSVCWMSARCGEIRQNVNGVASKNTHCCE